MFYPTSQRLFLMKKNHRTLFWFRQDFRVEDNVGLRNAVQDSKQVMLVFIFDEEILARFSKGLQRIGFLIEAIQQLDEHLKTLGSRLLILHGKPQELIPELVKTYQLDAVYTNRSYGLGSQTRDRKLQQRSQDHGVSFQQFKDYLLVEPWEVEQRKVFTPFYKLRQKKVPDQISLLSLEKFESIENVTYSDAWKHIPHEKNLHRDVKFATQRLEEFAFATYQDTRNIPSLDGSSRLSPYLRFGLISPRQLYLVAKKTSETYVSELAWREFWQHIARYFPETQMIEFQEKKRNLKWNNDLSHFQAWKEGMTWYPMVDAGMRQLKAQNRMHNRVRMVVASFLCKDLMIDWRRGEQHFADYLLDYDRNVNIGNRQWSASVGADPKPLRIFSPMLQSERFDPEAHYIKQWIPELRDIPAKMIHEPLKYDLNYARPIVDHYEWSKRAKEMYRG